MGITNKYVFLLIEVSEILSDDEELIIKMAFLIEKYAIRFD